MQAADLIEKDAEGHEHTRAESDWKLGENAHPIRDRVVIQRQEPDVRYKVDGVETQIQVPETERKKSPWCEVIAVGPQVTEIAPGDKVVVHTWAGEPIHSDTHERLFVVLEEDIEAVLA